MQFGWKRINWEVIYDGPGLKKLMLVELKLFLREPEAFFFTLIFPLIMLVVFGSIYGNEPTLFLLGGGGAWWMYQSRLYGAYYCYHGANDYSHLLVQTLVGE